ncbi:hypothetical protein SeMB42_g00221 [Synchytrium endobioticum]|uniref:Uncharacterized protein n=1 Tax=Synchytrium endobioticum TaxID=286115 RepID=A0A507DUC4_9FUNG|nr:hypothetical protein SeMB42_g00221 [Synchytrium endobioticum]
MLHLELPRPGQNNSALNMNEGTRRGSYVPRLNSAQSLSAVLDAKERGNQAYAKHKFSQAVADYTKALSYFATISPILNPPVKDQSTADSAKDKDNDKDKNDPTYILSTLLSNRSASYMEVDKVEDALRDAKDVVRIRPQWVKGQYRKAEALLRRRRVC